MHYNFEEEKKKKTDHFKQSCTDLNSEWKLVNWFASGLTDPNASYTYDIIHIYIEQT